MCEYLLLNLLVLQFITLAFLTLTFTLLTSVQEVKKKKKKKRTPTADAVVSEPFIMMILLVMVGFICSVTLCYSLVTPKFSVYFDHCCNILLCVHYQLDQLKVGSPIAKTPTKAEENVLEANLFRGGGSLATVISSLYSCNNFY